MDTIQGLLEPVAEGQTPECGRPRHHVYRAVEKPLNQIQLLREYRKHSFVYRLPEAATKRKRFRQRRPDHLGCCRK